ncbi:hypothetical protein STEG23_036277 [Scotinomys teguina]
MGSADRGNCATALCIPARIPARIPASILASHPCSAAPYPLEPPLSPLAGVAEDLRTSKETRSQLSLTFNGSGDS